MPTVEPLELVNKSTQEKLTLWKKSECNWLLKRCPIIVGETATIQWENDDNWDNNYLNNVKFQLWRGNHNIGWICGDVWMDILPSFDHAQLGLKMALLSDRFDCLVDKHFDGKSELTLWRAIEIRKDKGPKAKMSVWINGIFVQFPMPDRPLPTKIRIKDLRIVYIDHSVIAFLRSNKQIWDRMGTKLKLFCANAQPIWDVFVHEIWPVFATNIRHLYFSDGDHLDNLRRHTSPTILTDLDQLNSIDSGRLLPGGIADDEPNTTAGQALSKWLHTPSKNGQPKRFRLLDPSNLEWVNNFKETFRHATTSVSFNIQLFMPVETTPIEQFELVNERTKEKLTLSRYDVVDLLLKRCPISFGETATNQWENDENWDANLNNIKFILWSGGINFIGPLSRPAEEEK